MNTGIYRRVDDLGRIVIPKEIRQALYLEEGDLLEISTVEKRIVLTPYAPLTEVDFLTRICIKTIAQNEIPAVVTSKNEVLVSSDSQILPHSTLTPELRLLIQKKEEYVPTGSLKVLLIPQQKHMVLAIFPIQKHGELYGSLVFVGDSHTVLTEKQLEQGRVLAAVVSTAMGER